MGERTRALRLAIGGALAVVAVLGGCSYSPNPTAFPTHLSTIAVPVFQNKTTQPTLEQQMTQAVVDKFIKNSKLKVVDEDHADLVVTGAVSVYKNAVFGFNAREQAQEYQVQITAVVTVKDRVKNRELWKDDALTRTANYFVVSTGGQPAQTEDDGRASAVDKLADAILTRTTESW
jgi:hypothetical protein